MCVYVCVFNKLLEVTAMERVDLVLDNVLPMQFFPSGVSLNPALQMH